MSDELTSQVVAAVRAAAESLRSGHAERLREEDLEDLVLNAFNRTGAQARYRAQGEGKLLFSVSDWEDSPSGPRGPDIGIYDGNRRVGFMELKWSDGLEALAHPLWDLIRAANAIRSTAASANHEQAFLLSGSTARRWNGTGAGAHRIASDIWPRPSDPVAVLNTEELVSRHAGEWRFLDKTSAGHPTYVPEVLEVKGLLNEPVPSISDGVEVEWYLRLTRLSVSGELKSTSAWPRGSS